MSQSLFVPHYFDSCNFACWKIKVRVFLKSMDKCVWASIEKGWTVQSTAVIVIVITYISTWNKDDLAAFKWNVEVSMPSL